MQTQTPPNLIALYRALGESSDRIIHVVTSQVGNVYHNRYFVKTPMGLCDVTLWVARYLGQRMDKAESHTYGHLDLVGMASALTRVTGLTIRVQSSF